MTAHPHTKHRWGDKDRDKKAHAILNTLYHYLPQGFLNHSYCVDIGCGNGEIAYYLSSYVKRTTGIDPEPWEQWAFWQQQSPNLCFMVESAMELSLPDGTVDIVLCNQVYEHVPDAKQLIREIYRIMKPGGFCYFAGPNLLFPIEPHVNWPFIHWVPRPLAVRIMKLTGSPKILDAYSKHYWQLTNWLQQFSISNAVPYIIKNPVPYGHDKLYWRSLSLIPCPLLHYFTFLSPTFVFILRKY